MEAIFETLPATLAGGLAALCLTAAPMMRSRSGVLTMQLAAGFAFATHTELMGVWAASLVNVLGRALAGVASVGLWRNPTLKPERRFRATGPPSRRGGSPQPFQATTDTGETT